MASISKTASTDSSYVAGMRNMACTYYRNVANVSIKDGATKAG